MRRALLASVSAFALATAPAQGANTSVQWGANKASNPWSVCLYDSTNTCQTIFTLTPTGGVVVWLQPQPPSLLFTQLVGATIQPNITRVTDAGYSVVGVGVADYVVDANVNSAFVSAHPNWSFLSADSRGWRLSFQPYASVTPEQFGVLGTTTLSGSVITDDSAGINAMADYGRYFGQLIVSGNSAAVYTINGNPYWPVNIPYIDIDFHGATLMNLLGRAGASGFAANYSPLVTAGMYLPNGPNPYIGCTVNGFPIATVAAGSTTVTAADGATTIPVGQYFLSSQNRLQAVIGYPPAAAYQEYMTVVTAGITATLREPLQNAYEQNSPEFTNGSYTIFGPANILPLSGSSNNIVSPQGTCAFVPYTIAQYQNIRNFTTALPPGYIGPANQGTKVTIGGAWVGRYSGITSNLMYITTGKDLELDNSTISGANSTVSTLEIDKDIDHMTLRNVTTGAQLSSAYGVNDLDIYDSYITGGVSLTPIRTMSFHGGTLNASANVSGTSIFGQDPGVPVIKLEGTRILPLSTQTQIINVAAYSSVVGSVSTTTGVTTLSQTRSAYNTASAFYARVRVGTVLYNSSDEPVFLVTRGFYCPDGNVLTGNVAVDGIMYTTISPGDTLRAFSTGDRLEWSEAKIDGPLKNQITTTIGTIGNTTYPEGVAIRGKDRPDEFTITYDQTITAVPRTSNVYLIPVGCKFIPSQIIFDVHVAATSAASLAVRTRLTTGSSAINQVQAFDETALGTRIIDRSGNSLLGSDTLGAGGGILSPGTYFQDILITDPSQTLGSTFGQAQWTLTEHGRCLK